MTDSRKKATELADALIDLLNEERDALLKGDYDAVGGLFDRKKTLAEEMETLFADEAPQDGAELDKASATRLQKALSRNEAMLSGAREGVEQARRRLAAIARKRNEVGVYDPSGERPQMTGASGSGGRRV